MIDHTVSIVIPTFEGIELLKQNLPSVLKAARRQDEIVIVDDASSDTSVDWLVKKYDLVKNKSTDDYTLWESKQSNSKSVSMKVIVNLHNLRFGAACNRGVELASKDLILLLNSDVVPEPNIMHHLVPHFADETMFAVGCHEIEENKNGASGGKNRLWFERGMFIHSRAKDYETGDTAWASGGSALFDRKKWLKLGGFDPQYYPAYWEDVDLSFKARKRGWRVMFDAQAIVHHNHETTNSDVFGQLKMMTMSWRNARKFTWTHSSIWQKMMYCVWTPYWWIRTRT